MAPFDWLEAHPSAFWWLGGASLFAFVGTLLAVPVLVARIPDDYFLKPPSQARGRGGFWGVKNVGGVVLVAMGIVMLVLPGQGILTILLGVMLLDFPGKRDLELWLLQRPSVLRSVTWIRRRAGREPLRLAPRSRGEASDRD